MGDRLPFFGDLEASQRASVQLVVQAALVNFAEWMRNPLGDVGYTAEAFALVPQELTRRIALRQTVDMVRVTMEHFEEVVPLLARNDEQMTALTVGILRYSRNLAFAAASGYADAAEARGAWDTRMEANVVDAVVRGDVGPELQSQAAALNWEATAPATVLVGFPQPGRADFASEDVHEIVNRNGRAALSDVHGTWLVAIVSGVLSPTDRFLTELLEVFADGPVVIGPVARLVVRRPLQRHGSDRRHERRRGMERRPASCGRARIASRTCAVGRFVGDRRAGLRRHAPVGRGRSRPRRNTGRVPRFRGRHRSMRPQIVRSSKHGALPTQADRGLHRAGSHRATRRLRAESRHDGRSAWSSGMAFQHDKRRCAAANTRRDRRFSRRAPAVEVAARSRWCRITCRFVDNLQKHKTRFIIPYTAQNGLHSVFLIRAPKPRACPACSRTGIASPRHARPVAGTARCRRASRGVVGDQRPRSRATGHHRDGRGDHRHRGDSAARRRRNPARTRRAEEARLCWPMRIFWLQATPLARSPPTPSPE